MDKKIFYVLSSHWDREWYQTFQDYRYRLFGLFDKILECLKSGDLKGPFYTDGQACVLDDYLEIRPECRDELRKKLQNDEVVSGPWYVLPDEFLVSGESLIRNIQLGLKTVRDFGAEPSKSGFLCDMFGHISQMPQLFHLFGIKGCFLWRGVNVSSRLVIWEGADGTCQPTYVCAGEGYGDYAFIRGMSQTYEHFNEKVFVQKLKSHLEKECVHTPVKSILLFDGCDHQYFDEQPYKSLLRYCSEHGIEIVHVGLDTYFQNVEKETDKIKTRIKGQLRQVTEDYKVGSHLIFGVLSSRIDLKQENSYCQNTLCRWAEPYSLQANLSTDKEYPQGFLDTAWKWLIKNHPHDSICGCSIDQVHEDMKYRFSQTRQIAERITEESLKTIALNTDCVIEEGQLKVVVFNPLPHELAEVVTIDVDIPEDWPVFQEFFGYEKLPVFRVFDTEGIEIPYQRISQQTNCINKVIQNTKLPATWNSTKIKVAMDLTLPPMGYKTLIVKQASEGEPVRHPSTDTILKSENCLENDFLEVMVKKDGSLTLIDKRTQQTYSGLMTFEENADIGDGWFHGMAVNDRTCYSGGVPSYISLVENGPELATLKVTKIMRLPECFCFDSMFRSDSLKEFTIDNYVTLRKHSDRVEIETQINNNIKDHRLRVLFPTQTQADTFVADSVFDVAQCPIAIDNDNYKKKELQTDTRPQQNWTAISDSERGLAVISPGQYETAVSADTDRAVKLTLFRSTRRTFMTTGQPGGQLLKPLTFKYWIIPFSGQADYFKLFNDSDELANGIKSVQFRKKDIDIYASENDKKLPPQQGHLSIKNAVMTSFRKRVDDVELRVFNPYTTEQVAEMKLLSAEMKTFRSAVSVDFEGNIYGDPVRVTKDQLTVTLKPKQITTLSLRKD